MAEQAQSKRAPGAGGSGAPRREVDLGLVLRTALAAGTAGAALGHLSAARDHPAHAHIAAFFVVVAVAQVGAAALVAWRPSDRVIRAALTGNALVVGIWLCSRISGIPFVDGADHAEAIAVKDVLTTFLEVLAIAAGGLLLGLPDRARRVVLPSGEQTLAAVLAGAVALAFPAALADHGHGDGHGDHGHGQAATHDDDHPHGGEGEVHDHAGTVLAERHDHVDAAHAGHGESGSGQGGHAHATVAGARAHADHAHGGSAPHHGAHGDDGSYDPAVLDFASAPGRVTTVRYGPFTLPPASTNEARHRALVSNTILTDLPPPCRDCFLTALDFDLVYEDGAPANFDTGAMLHHHVMFNSGEEDPTCGRWSFDAGVGWLGRRIFAAGNERTGGPFPRGFGYRVGSNDWWTGIFEIMNLVERPQNVYVKLAVKYVPASQKLKALEPIWLDVDNCGDSQYTAPAGASVTDWDWTSDRTGRVMFAGGHVHDGGLDMVLSNATTGERQCRSAARYGTIAAFQGHLEAMTVCSWDRIGTVRKGEVLRISTRYELPEADPTVMGIMMIWLHETDDLSGGTRAPTGMTDPPESGAPPPSGGHHH